MRVRCSTSITAEGGPGVGEVAEEHFADVRLSSEHDGHWLGDGSRRELVVDWSRRWADSQSAPQWYRASRRLRPILLELAEDDANHGLEVVVSRYPNSIPA